MAKFVVCLFALLWILTGCTYDLSNEALMDNTMDSVIEIPVPEGFPSIVYPEDNQPTESRVALGKRLFYDVRLSADGTVSCATCHLPEVAFADPEAISTGINGLQGFRNAPTLANVAWHPYYFMDGGVPTLELQVLAPLENEVEMAHSITAAAEELRSDPELNALSEKAYAREMDPYVVTRSLAAFQRTLISGDSRYDRFLEGNTSALSPEEVQGMDLFFSERAQCGSCHNGPLLTDFSFRNIGLYEVYEDKGRRRVTAMEEDNGKFKVPSLRNVALTSPYMHDGSLNSLEEVVAHFNSGGSEHPNKDTSIAPLNLTTREQANLVAFLHTLTDIPFVTNPDHR